MKYNIEEIYAEYKIREENALLLIEEVKFIILECINREKINIHSLKNRFKEFDSFLGKVERKKSENPFHEIYDLIGFRITCLFLEDIQNISDLLKINFELIETFDSMEEGDYDVFGYMACHHKAMLKHNSKFNGIAKNYPFEIQVMTIAKNAWASISHHLFYKKEFFLPDNLKRDFHALSALLYIADKQFSLLRKEQFVYYLEQVDKLNGD
ncbi:MAG: hypothetical protein FJ128_00405 [Deltaproteobacteria bacterium]|nr:hypothetical protein [Deltaproteobacteria bacterium]